MGFCALFLISLLLGGGAEASSSTQNPATLIAEVLRTGSVVVQDIEFASGSEKPSDGSTQALRSVRAMLLEHDEWMFEVRVYCAGDGDTARDRMLALARAKAVVVYLVGEGIAAARLVPRGVARIPEPSEPPTKSRDGRNLVELKKLNEE